MTDHNYPLNYKKNDKLQEYIEARIDGLTSMYLQAQIDLDDESYKEFDKQIKEYINQ